MWEVINKNENLTPDDFDKVKKTFVNIYRQKAEKNTYIQDDDGNWIKK